MATSTKELEKQAKREQYAKEFAGVYSKKDTDAVNTWVKYDGTPKH